MGSSIWPNLQQKREKTKWKAESPPFLTIILISECHTKKQLVYFLVKSIPTTGPPTLYAEKVVVISSLPGDAEHNVCLRPPRRARGGALLRRRLTRIPFGSQQQHARKLH